MKLSNEDWKIIVEDQAGSGLSGLAYCKSKGLHQSSFSKYKRRFSGLNDRKLKPRTSRPIRKHQQQEKQTIKLVDITSQTEVEARITKPTLRLTSTSGNV